MTSDAAAQRAAARWPAGRPRGRRTERLDVVDIRCKRQRRYRGGVMNDLNPSERRAHAFLEHFGFPVQSIQRNSDATPDFMINLDPPHYLIEVKSRGHSEEFDDIEPGEVYTTTQHLHWSLTVYKQAKKAARQLAQRDPAHERIWIVWYDVDDSPFTGDSPLHQVRGTLLGSHDVIDLATMSDSGVSSKDCFYAQAGVFEKFPQIDGAILAGVAGYQMWVNEFARPELLIRSRLGQLFTEKSALNVPKEHADAGRAYLLEGGRGQRPDAEVIQYLRDRCGVRMPQVLRFQTHTGMTSVVLADEAAQREPEERG